MSKQYSLRPSQIIGVEDDYTAFCFDEACAFIRAKLEAGEKPHYKVFREEQEVVQEYESFTEFYKDYCLRNDIT